VWLEKIIASGKLESLLDFLIQIKISAKADHASNTPNVGSGIIALN
jgi:hypothetical protein